MFFLEFFLIGGGMMLLVIMCSYSPLCSDCCEQNPVPAPPSRKPVVLRVAHTPFSSSRPPASHLSPLGAEYTGDLPSGEALPGVSPSATLALALSMARGDRNPRILRTTATSLAISDRGGPILPVAERPPSPSLIIHAISLPERRPQLQQQTEDPLETTVVMVPPLFSGHEELPAYEPRSDLGTGNRDDGQQVVVTMDQDQESESSAETEVPPPMYAPPTL